MLPSLLRQSKLSLNRFRRKYPSLRHISLATISLVLIWLYVLHQGERATFAAKIAACDWQKWEQLPEDAQPHRAILIADPQLVDAHTYPGRPWPLSSLTEQYTDRYMARSYRLINGELDPDSIIFLGDMFDGGREWAPAKAWPLTDAQKWTMEVRSPRTKGVPAEWSKIEVPDPGWKRHSKSLRRNVDTPEELHNTPEKVDDQSEGIDPTNFVRGEDGRWKQYGNRYWEEEYNRFGKIFLAPDQLYPGIVRQTEIMAEVRQDAVNVENGAKDEMRSLYGTTAGKSRTVLSSLPGNHDFGFGAGVQLPIRARHKWHFGESNRVDILGNHTLVSIDALSLAAWSQFEDGGHESQNKDAKRRKHIYATAQNFLDDLPQAVDARFNQTLKEFSLESATPAQQLPVILLTHVPLFRQAETLCGPQRERGSSLHLAGGYQYQNVLTETLTNAITHRVGKAGPISHVFSGDDHDYCKVDHQFDASGAVTEETVKSFSWAMGVRHPGFMMLSLWNPIDDDGNTGSHISSHLCLLPDQLGIFIRYAWLLGISIVVLLIQAVVFAASSSGSEDDETPILQIYNLWPASLTKLTTGKAPAKKHRNRASSSGLKPPSNDNPSVQRSQNARARSVSPGINYGLPFGHNQKLTERPMQSSKQVYLPDHPSDDEESRIGDMDYLNDGDGKWRSSHRTKGKTRQIWDDFSVSSLLVASIAGCYYIYLIRHG